MGILSWVVFGLIAGVLAKWIMPGKDPGGCVVTILLGVGGAIIGGFILRASRIKTIGDLFRISPLSPYWGTPNDDVKNRVLCHVDVHGPSRLGWRQFCRGDGSAARRRSGVDREPPFSRPRSREIGRAH